MSRKTYLSHLLYLYWLFFSVIVDNRRFLIVMHWKKWYHTEPILQRILNRLKGFIEILRTLQKALEFVTVLWTCFGFRLVPFFFQCVILGLHIRRACFSSLSVINSSQFEKANQWLENTFVRYDRLGNNCCRSHGLWATIRNVFFCVVWFSFRCC